MQERLFNHLAEKFGAELTARHQAALNRMIVRIINQFGGIASITEATYPDVKIQVEMEAELIFQM